MHALPVLTPAPPPRLLCRIMCVLFWLAVVAAVVVIFVVLLPRALAKPMGALIRLILTKLTKGQLAALCLGAIILLPCTMILPMQPFIWILGE